jgi:hypothetical protein
MSAKGNKTL